MRARFQQLRNDLFWEIFDPEKEEYIRWSGYDDHFWWKNIANSEDFQIKNGYRLNPLTDEVTKNEEKGE